MQFYINSYILNPHIKTIQYNDPNLSNYFLPLQDLDTLKKEMKKLNPEELEGYIHISDSTGQILMDAKYWDSITILWCYILNLIEAFFEEKHASIYFPDQPIKVSIEKLDDKNIKFSIDKIKKELPMDHFLDSLLNSAQEYFQKIGSDFSSGKFVAQLNQIKKLKKQLIS